LHSLKAILSVWSHDGVFLFNNSLSVDHHEMNDKIKPNKSKANKLLLAMASILQDLLGEKEFLAYLFVVGWLLLNWPLIELCKDHTILGMPGVLVYVACIWLLLILALFIFDRRNSE